MLEDKQTSKFGVFFVITELRFTKIMAPKEKQTTSRGKKENTPKPLWNQEKFLTKEQADHYHKIMGLRSVIPEVKFDLKEDEYPEIQEQIRNRSWKS